MLLVGRHSHNHPSYQLKARMSRCYMLRCMPNLLMLLVKVSKDMLQNTPCNDHWFVSILNNWGN